MMTYKYLVWAVLLGAGIAGGWLGWWHVSKSLYLRRADSELFGEATMRRGLLMRRQLWRIVMTVAGATVGMAVGMIALMSLARFQN